MGFRILISDEDSLHDAGNQVGSKGTYPSSLDDAGCDQLNLLVTDDEQHTYVF